MIDKIIYITGCITWIVIAVFCLLYTINYILCAIIFFKQHNKKQLKRIAQKLYCRHKYILYETATVSHGDIVTSEGKTYLCSKCKKEKTVYIKIKPNTPSPWQKQ